MIKLTPAWRKKIEEDVEAQHACGDSKLAEAMTMLLKGYDQAVARVAELEKPIK